MPETREKVLERAAETLTVVRENSAELEKSIERCEEDYATFIRVVLARTEKTRPH